KTSGMDDMQVLSLAIHCNLPNIAKVLLERGADVHAADRWGRTALHITASKGYPGLAQELVQRGADVNARNTKKSTPLMFAVNEDCDKTANILIDHNADIDAQNEDGWTALIYAAKNIHLDSTRLLLARKANCEIEDNNGCTAHDHITAGRQPPEAAVIKFLLEESSLARIKEKFEAAAAAGTPQKRTIRRRPPTPGA
ncbi:MAG: ankyrin repeat domain-containing protein, partial [Alphaproteobacteria bacterium]|nr:ankyrin repeat domain-containing protein [Alphaproteobacteria bacterium]